MRTVIATIALAATALTLSGCNEASTSQQQETARDNIMDRAHQSVRIPEVSNFLTREYVAEYMRRMDEPNKTFYVYVVADTGQMLGYYVARSAPVNICTFLTPPDRVERTTSSSVGRVLRKASGADGVYYGDSACNTEYFFDAETDALVQIQGLNLFVSDQPLEMDAKPIRVQTTD
ncbi:hypothetical protein [Thioalkalivibrio sp. ALE12]|uniref:hypothetical protein n=1 Tax=Thioalkalivibrio sp. ALE12 TaxID=1158170 RepID=UPI00037120E9|nr:hypothetical protein [Thioalkalivibrio sp. ALE12]